MESLRGVYFRKKEKGQALIRQGSNMNRLDTKEIIGILMESAFYFELNLKERCSLIKRILDLSSHSVLVSHP